MMRYWSRIGTGRDLASRGQRAKLSLASVMGSWQKNPQGGPVHLAGDTDVESQAAESALPGIDVAPLDESAMAGGSAGLFGPFEAKLREIGVTSPRFLGRAARLDRSGQKIVTEAATQRIDEHASPAGGVGAQDTGELTGGLPHRSNDLAPHLNHGFRPAAQEFEAEP